jgi:hypothetical protein
MEEEPIIYRVIEFATELEARERSCEEYLNRGGLMSHDRTTNCWWRITHSGKDGKWNCVIGDDVVEDTVVEKDLFPEL